MLSAPRVTGIFLHSRVTGFSQYSQPPFSKTMVRPSVEGNFTSYSVKLVIFSVSLVRVL